MTTAVQTAQFGNTNPAWRNRIINGAMTIDQRNAGAAITPTDNQYVMDRFKVNTSQSGKFATQQNANGVTGPAGFPKMLGVVSSSAYSVGSGDYFFIQQPVEGQNVSDLAWGTANAATVTLSFWVQSSLTGTFGGSLRNSAENRSYPFSYTISSANTWEQKTITIAGDTSGTWLTTNGIGVGVCFSLGTGTTYSGTAGSWASANYVSATGATSVVGTNGATFYITGVQLEKGSTATSFDYRPYGTELMLCQRYCVLYAGNNGSCFASGMNYTTVNAWGSARMPVTMRTTPTLSCVTGTQYYRMFYNTTYQSFDAVLDAGYAGSDNLGNLLFNNTLSGLTAGAGNIWLTNNASSKLLYTAEL